jgi:hypothetical protein
MQLFSKKKAPAFDLFLYLLRVTITATEIAITKIIITIVNIILTNIYISSYPFLLLS